jgi:ankyrin repeat protein
MSVPFHFDFLRKEAKALLRECRAGNRQTIDRFRACLPRLANLEIAQAAESIKLGDVQHALAREHGYTNWAELKREDSPLEQFLVSIRGNAFKDAQRSLAGRPELAAENIHAACAIGDPDAAALHLDRNPQLLTTEHREWPPLFYACASLLNRVTARQSAGILECVRLLLDRGADPNTSVKELSALRRAMLSGNMPVVMLLMQRGAKPNLEQWSASASEAFREFFASPEVRQRYQERMVSLAKDQGQSTLWGSDKWWFHSPGGAEPPMMYEQMVRPILERKAANPNRLGIDGTAMIHLAARTGTVEVINLLLDHGADIHQTTAEGRTALVLAVRAGKDLNVDALRARGATNAGLRPVDELVGACMRDDAPATKTILRTHPEVTTQLAAEDYEVLVRAAGMNIRDRVKLMLDCGFDPGGFGESGITALHAAAWHGNVEVVRLLLEFHAPVNVRDRTYRNSPLAWAEHGAKHCRSAEADYAAITTALIAAGA